MLLTPMLVSLHFTSLWRAIRRELGFQRLNPIFPRPFPAECYPVKIIRPPGVDAVRHLKSTGHGDIWSTTQCGVELQNVHRYFWSMRPAGLTDPGPTPVYEDYVKDWAPMLSSLTDGHRFPISNRFGCTYEFFFKMTRFTIDDWLSETNKGRPWLKFNVQNKEKERR